METSFKKKFPTQTLHLKPRNAVATQNGSIAPLPAGAGNTTAEAPLPHERDESVGMTDGVPSEKMRQAYRDLARGLQDTGRGPEADSTYKKLK